MRIDASWMRALIVAVGVGCAAAVTGTAANAQTTLAERLRAGGDEYLHQYPRLPDRFLPGVEKPQGADGFLPDRHPDQWGQFAGGRF
jgi:hypothetical protein